MPRRSVHWFLQATLQVWHPMHLSRWNTVAICERTFMACPRSVLRRRDELAHADEGVPVVPGGAPVVEGEGELAVAAQHERGLEAHPRQAVVASGPLAAALRAPWHADGPLRSVVEQAQARGDARGDDAAHH